MQFHRALCGYAFGFVWLVSTQSSHTHMRRPTVQCDQYTALWHVVPAWPWKLAKPVKAVHQADPAGSNEGSGTDFSCLLIDFCMSTISCSKPKMFFSLLPQPWATKSNECLSERSWLSYSTELHSRWTKVFAMGGLRFEKKDKGQRRGKML